MANAMIKKATEAVRDRLSRDSRGECLLIATDEQAEDVARAAIEAIRRPTPDMIEAAYHSSAFWSAESEHGYEIMIEEILK